MGDNLNEQEISAKKGTGAPIGSPSEGSNKKQRCGDKDVSMSSAVITFNSLNSNGPPPRYDTCRPVCSLCIF